jgi:hypothetical protein
MGRVLPGTRKSRAGKVVRGVQRGFAKLGLAQMRFGASTTLHHSVRLGARYREVRTSTYRPAPSAKPGSCIFNTEDLVPTLPLPTIDNDPTSLGLLDTNIELVLKLFFKPSPFLFQHVDSPVALTYQLNTVADNHNLTQLYSRCADAKRSSRSCRSSMSSRMIARPRPGI